MNKSVYNFKKQSLQSEVVHGGQGQIAWARIIEFNEKSSINFIDRAVVPPGSSIGKHFHQDSEEMYFILSGTGLMSLGENTFSIHPFDIVIVSQDSHALINNSDDDIELFVIEVKLPKGCEQL